MGRASWGNEGVSCWCGDACDLRNQRSFQGISTCSGRQPSSFSCYARAKETADLAFPVTSDYTDVASAPSTSVLCRPYPVSHMSTPETADNRRMNRLEPMPSVPRPLGRNVRVLAHRRSPFAISTLQVCPAVMGPRDHARPLAEPVGKLKLGNSC